MFPEREALIRTPDTLERERKEPPPDGRRLQGLAYGSSLPLGATQRAHLPEKFDELFGPVAAPMPATRRDSAMPIAVMALCAFAAPTPGRAMSRRFALMRPTTGVSLPSARAVAMATSPDLTRSRYSARAPAHLGGSLQRGGPLLGG